MYRETELADSNPQAITGSIAMGYRCEPASHGAGDTDGTAVPSGPCTGSGLWAWFNRGVLPPGDPHGPIRGSGRQHLQQNVAAVRLALDAKHSGVMGKKPALFANYNEVLQGVRKQVNQTAADASELWRDEAAPNRGSKFKRALELANDEAETEEAVAELKQSFYSVTNASAQARRRQDAVELATKLNKGEHPFPLRALLVLKFAATLRKAGFASADHYLGALKLVHLELDHDYRPALKRAFDLCKRALTRNQGPRKRAPEIQLADFPTSRERHDRATDQLAFPFLVYAAALVFMLRLDELHKPNWEDVQFADDHDWISVKLHTSKTDQTGRGVRRTLRCTCKASPAMRPVEIYKKLKASFVKHKVGVPEGKIPVAATSEGVRASKPLHRGRLDQSGWN